MAEEDAHAAGPESARRVNVLAFSHGHHLGAHQSCVAGPPADGKRQYKIDKSLAEEGGKSDG